MEHSLEITKYFAQNNVDWAGNPLIEFFPPVSREHLAKMMTFPVTFSPEERDHSDEQRIDYLWRISKFYVPLPEQLDFAQDFWSTILNGYTTRNPLKKQTTESFNDFCEAISSGAAISSTDDVLINCPMLVSLIGTPGVGKGRTAQALLGRMPKMVLHHKKYGPVYQVLYVWVEAPDTNSYISMLGAIYKSLLEHAESIGLPVPLLKKSPARGDFENEIETLAKKLNLGVLIIDEIQHLCGSTAVNQSTMKFLTGLVNRLGFPVLIIGTWPALAVVSKEVRIMRRTVNRASRRFKKMENGPEWHAFIDAIFRLQWVRNPVDAEESGFVDLFYYHCQGIADLAVKLMMLCQVTAIRDGSEKISTELINLVANTHFPTIAPAIEQMRKGRQETNPLLWDAEPFDFDAYYAALVVREKGFLGSAKQQTRKVNEINLMSKAIKVANGLVATGFADEKTAESLSTEEVKKNPNKSAPHIVKNILSKGIRKSPRPTKRLNKQAEMEARFNVLDDNDLRKIIYFGHKDKVDAAISLERNGLMLNAIEENII